MKLLGNGEESEKVKYKSEPCENFGIETQRYQRQRIKVDLNGKVPSFMCEALDKVGPHLETGKLAEALDLLQTVRSTLMDST